MDNLVGPDLTVVPENHPQLRQLVCNRDPKAPIPGADALAIYEAEWRHVEANHLDEQEKLLIQTLVDRYGNGNFMPAR
jgi:hypothetical protein